MPIPMVLTSSDAFSGSMKYSRFGGPIFSGQIADGGSGGPLPAPGAVALIQSTAALLTQTLSTDPTALGRGSYIYIPQTTAGPATSSFAAGVGAPPYSGIGAAIIWTGSKLGVYSTISGSGTWFFTATMTSSA